MHCWSGVRDPVHIAQVRLEGLQVPDLFLSDIVGVLGEAAGIARDEVAVLAEDKYGFPVVPDVGRVVAAEVVLDEAALAGGELRHLFAPDEGLAHDAAGIFGLPVGQKLHGHGETEVRSGSGEGGPGIQRGVIHDDVLRFCCQPLLFRWLHLYSSSQLSVCGCHMLLKVVKKLSAWKTCFEVVMKVVFS